MAKELNNLFITAKNVIGFPKYLFILKNSIKMLLFQKVWFKHGWNSFPQEFNIF